MTLRQVRCTALDENVLDRAHDVLAKDQPITRGATHVVGWVDDGDLRKLEAPGLFVEVIPERSTIGWLEPEGLPRSIGTAMESAPPAAYEALARGAPERFVVQFRGPLSKDQSARIEGLGVVLGSYVPDFAYKTSLDDAQARAVEALGFVQRVVPYDEAMTLRRRALPIARNPAGAQDELLGAAPTLAPRLSRAGPSSAVPPTRMFHLRCHNAADLDAVAATLRGDARVVKVERGSYRLRVTARAQDVEALEADLARLPQVSVIEPFEFPTPQSSFARQGIALDTPGIASLKWTGEGQIVGVVDSGADTGHPDLHQALKKLIERVEPEAPDDPFGHGTHVCGIVAGDGTASNGTVKGVAPGCRLVVQAIRDAEGRFSAIPVDLGELFDEAYAEGVRICNLSWGFSGAGFYTTDAYELDRYVYEHPDFLVVVAAGNDGRQPDPLPPGDTVGRIGYSSICAPATAKNALTVGASCSPRDDGPYKDVTWSSYAGSLPSPQAPLVAQERINGDADCLAAFSSRGPTDDTRVKPDLVVPGTVILAARSEPSTPPPAFVEPAYGGRYRYDSGTSMAAPIVAGAAALVRQYYVEELQLPQPSAALIKATLVNGCVWMGRATAEDPAVGRPNFHQGFGRLDLRAALAASHNGATLKAVDIARTDPDALDSNQPARSTWRKRVQVRAGVPLRVTLCWTDYAAHGLQNQLDLLIQRPAGTLLSGNPDLKRGPWAKTDRFNNVQQIDLPDPEAGLWTIAVSASNTPFPPQGFSLVATADFAGDW